MTAQPPPPPSPVGPPPVAGRVRPRASALLRRDPLLLVLALMLLTYVWRVQDLFPAFGTLSPALLATIVAIVVWFFDADPRRRLDHLRSPVLTLVLVLVVLMILSVPGGMWPGNSVRFLYKDFGLTFMFMLLVATSIRGSKDLEWFAQLHLFGAGLYSAVVLLRYQVKADGRLGGLRYYDANDLAMVLVCTLPFAVYFLRKAVKPWLRVAGFAGLGLLVLTIVKTGSRGGFLGLVVVMGYILFQFRAISKKARFLAGLAGVVVVMVVGSEKYWERIQSLTRPQEDYNWSENNLAGRGAIWKRGLTYMVRRPLFGVGVRCFPQAEGMLADVSAERARENKGFKWSAPHNSFVEIGAEVGLPALMVFVAIFVTSIKTLARLKPRPPTVTPEAMADGALAQALIGSLLGYVTSGFFLSQGYSAFLYTLLGMIIGLSKLHPEIVRAAARATGRTRRRSPLPPAWPQPIPPPA